MSNIYKRDVSFLESIDVYRVLELYSVPDSMAWHAIKKLLCAGQRGNKDYEWDIREAINSLERELEMISEVKNER